MTSTDSLTLRVAGPADADALERLAALDSAAPLVGTVLLAEVAGTAVAALATGDERVVADPFTPTAGVVTVLRARAAAQRRGAARGRGRLPGARLRPA